MSKQTKKKKSTFSLALKRMFLGDRGEVDIFTEEQMQGPLRTIIKNFISNKIALIGLIIFLSIFLSCFILPIFFPLDVTHQDVTQQNIQPGFSMLAVPKKLANNAAMIDGGATFGVGIDKDGAFYSWGHMDDRLKAVPDNMGKLVQVSAGLNHILALNEKGELFTWGYNRLRLDKIPLELKMVKDIKQIEAGYQISFVLDEGGRLYYWGNENLISISAGKYQGQIDKIASNTTTVMALLKDGSVVALTNKETPFATVPAELERNAVDIASTDTSAAAVTRDGRVVVWGSDEDVKAIPEEIQGKTISVSGGRAHFTALTSDGQVVSWGANNYKQSNAPAAANGAEQISCGYYQNYAIHPDGSVTTWGLEGYLMGTDGFGRDIFTRLISGGRLTMTIGAIAVIIATIIGVIIGGISGYYGGKVDNFLMRFAEIVNAIPFLPFAMILSTILGNSVSEMGRIAIIMVILGALTWPSLARLTRGQILAEREKEFVTAAKAMGVKEMAIIFRHILPNVITQIIVSTTLSFATSMLTESSLSFLGFGIIEPTPTWGNMLTGSQSSTVISEYWWRWVFPSIALGLSTISINLIGDGLRDAIDPRSNDR